MANNIIETGPSLHRDQPTSEELQCIASNFPVCSSDVPSGVITCDPCIDRSKVKIGVVHHGVPEINVFWAGVDGAIGQGAKDMNIDLVYDPLTSETDVNGQMIEKIDSYCSSGDLVNAIVVSVLDESILQALEACDANNIPVAIINAGYELVKDKYEFFGQNEYQAGFDAGDALSDSAEKLCCLSLQDGGVNVQDTRCRGFHDALISLGKSDLYGNATVSHDCANATAAILNQCGPEEGKDWTTVGLYLAGGQPLHECGISFLRDYPDVTMGASDVSDELYKAMDDGLRMVFGIDQQSKYKSTMLRGTVDMLFILLPNAFQSISLSRLHPRVSSHYNASTSRNKQPRYWK